MDWQLINSGCPGCGSSAFRCENNWTGNLRWDNQSAWCEGCGWRKDWAEIEYPEPPAEC